MTAYNMAQDIKRYIVLVALAASHRDSRMTSSIGSKVRNVLAAPGADFSSVAKRKKYYQWLRISRTVEFILQLEIIDQPFANNSKGQRSLSGVWSTGMSATTLM